jgi:selenocysteine lyase/cysteine desulfurase
LPQRAFGFLSDTPGGKSFWHGAGWRRPEISFIEWSFVVMPEIATLEKDITTLTIDNLRDQIIGLSEEVPLLDGSRRQYINLDNAASTPTLVPVMDKVAEFLKWYGNVHRGTGFKSKLSSWVFEESRNIIARFINADLTECVVIFCKNTTEAVNKLAHRYPFEQGSVVLTSVMEHHSNELPWRRVAEVVHIEVTDDGRIDEEDFERKLREYGGKIRLIALSGASNVTGYINPIHYYARRAHAIGAKIMIDAAQLAPHRPIDMKPKDDPEHLDYLAFSAHKMYAPFGIGVLVGCRKTFEEGDPADVGGGTVDIVNLENAYWADLPDKEEAGTPDIVGAVALSRAIEIIEELGWKNIIRHESEITAYALGRLSEIPEVILYGDKSPKNAADRLGVISFNLKNMPHALVAAILSCEWGIGTRNGCFCAHPYVKCILHVSEDEARGMEERILARDRSQLPGTVRISFGFYNAKGEVDVLCNAIREIAKGEYKPGYLLDKERGEYYRDDFPVRFQDYFRL